MSVDPPDTLADYGEWARSLLPVAARLDEAKKRLDEDLNQLLRVADAICDGDAAEYLAGRARTLYHGEKSGR